MRASQVPRRTSHLSKIRTPRFMERGWHNADADPIPHPTALAPLLSRLALSYPIRTEPAERCQSHVIQFGVGSQLAIARAIVIAITTAILRFTYFQTRQASSLLRYSVNTTSQSPFLSYATPTFKLTVQPRYPDSSRSRSPCPCRRSSDRP